jgi:hypothetical protein
MRKASKDRQQAFPNGIALIGGIALHFRAPTELSRPRRPFEPAQSFTELTDIETVTDHGRVNLTHCRPQLDEPRSNVINLTRMIVDDHCELIELAGVIINGHDKLVERPLVPVEPGIDPIERKRCLGGTFRSARGRVMFEAHARASTHVDFRT